MDSKTDVIFLKKHLTVPTSLALDRPRSNKKVMLNVKIVKLKTNKATTNVIGQTELDVNSDLCLVEMRIYSSSSTWQRGTTKTP